MATRIPVRSQDTQTTSQPVGPMHLFVLAVGASAIVAVYAARAMSPDALLPAIRTTLFVSAAVLAALGWRQRKAKPAFITYWDASGALTLIGCAAAIMTEPETVMQLFELRQKN